jgi:hypothetical protein
MNKPIQLFIKSSILDRERQLTIEENFIQFDNKDLISDSPTRLSKSEITGFRHGIKSIYGYQFAIGKIYCIDLLTTDNQVLKIRAKTLYGIRKHQLNEKYRTIVNAVYDNFIDDISRNLLAKFAAGTDFEIAGILFTQIGLTLHPNSEIVRWEDVGTKSYSSYYAIFSKLNRNHYKAVEYLNDWNTGVLYSASKKILMDKGLEHE